MRAIERTRNMLAAFKSASRNRGDLVRWYRRRPLILAGVGAYESALLFSNALDPKLKELAELKAAGMVACEFCLDIGSALARGAGVTEHQIRELAVFADSDAYTETEKLVIAYAQAMSTTPTVAEDLARLRDELSTSLSEAELTELAATVAWENQRARLNQGLGVRPTGMSDGAACALPERSS